MLKFTNKDREQLTEMRQGWVCLLIFVCLLASYSLVDHQFGRGWGVVAGAGALLVWFLVRPWRFGLLPAHSRRMMRVMGVVAFTGLTLVSLLRYFRG